MTARAPAPAEKRRSQAPKGRFARGHARGFWLRASLAALTLSALQGAGAFRGLDRWLSSELSRLGPETERSVAPIVVALDERFVAKEGPPPWSLETWHGLARSLARSGVERAVVVEPVVRLVRRDAPSGDTRGDGAPTSGEPSAPEAELLVPTLLAWDPVAERMTAPRLEVPGAPFKAWDRHLGLPPSADGVLRDLPAAAAAPELGVSAFCDWLGACPDGGEMSVPVGQGEPTPTLSPLDLEGQGPRLQGHADVPVLIGLTAPGLAELVPVGPSATPVPRVAAVASALTGGLARRPTPVLGRAEQAVAVLAVWAASAFAFRRWLARRPGRAALGSALVVMVLAALASVSGLVVLPFTALALAALIAPVVSLFASSRLVTEFADDVVAVVEREGFRHSPQGALLRTREELASALARLSRTHTTSGRFGYFDVDPESRRLRLLGGFGVTQESLAAFTDDPGASPWREAATLEPTGWVDDSFFKSADLKAQLIPISAGTRVVGFWCLVLESSAAPLDAELVAELARWVGSRLALGDAAPKAAGLAVRAEARLQHVHELVVAATEERRQHYETLCALPAPMLVADLSGAVLYANRALELLLTTAEIGTVRSLRELVVRMKGEEAVTELLPRLFLDARAGEVVTSWKHPLGKTFRVSLYPIRTSDGPSPTSAPRRIGFAALLQDQSYEQELRELRGGVLASATQRLRNELMAITSYGALAEAAATDADVLGWLSKIEARANGAARALADLTASLTGESDAQSALPVDLGKLLATVCAELHEVASEKAVRLQSALPAIAQPVLVPPEAARLVLRRLLHEACTEAPRGGAVGVRMTEHHGGAEVRLSWQGPGLDESQQRLIETREQQPGSAAATLTGTLGAILLARRVFPTLRTESRPGAGTEVSIVVTRG